MTADEMPEHLCPMCETELKYSTRRIGGFQYAESHCPDCDYSRVET